jgi:MFS family permease
MRRLLATGGLMAVTAMQAADALIANVALPQLQHDLGGGVELGAWVITSYLCATAVAAPLHPVWMGVFRFCETLRGGAEP